MISEMGSRIYDSWEKLVVAVVRNEQLHELAMCHSRESSNLSECSSFREANYYPYETSCIASLSPRDRTFLMAGSRNLTIECGISTKRVISNNEYYDHPGSPEVEKLEAASWFVVRGRMKTFMMSKRTIYGAYLVGNWFEGRRSAAKSTIRFVSKESDAEEQAQIVTLGVFPSVDYEKNAASREDGWMEERIGYFYIDQGSDIEDVEVSLYVDPGNRDLTVAGMEFRSLLYVKQV